jgi:hypothetical protein
MFAIASLHERDGLANPINDPVVRSAWRAVLMATSAAASERPRS